MPNYKRNILMTSTSSKKFMALFKRCHHIASTGFFLETTTAGILPLLIRKMGFELD
jgi:hypothetical protein